MAIYSAVEMGLTITDATIELRTPGVNQTSTDENAEFEWAGLTLARLSDLGIYGPAIPKAHDHTDWVASGNVSDVDSGGNFVVSGSGNLVLTLACGYDTRQTDVPNGDAPEGPPLCYMIRRANHYYPAYGPNEARYCWLGIEAIGFPFTAPEDCTIDVTIVYREYQNINDNHLTDSTRSTEFVNTGTEQTVSYELEVSSGYNVNCLCLITPKDGTYPKLERIVSITLSFDTEGNWTIGEPKLAPTEYEFTQQAKLKTFEGVPSSLAPSQTYRHGGASVHLGAAFEWYDSQEENNGHDNGAELTVRNFDYLEGAVSGLDLTTAYSLDGYAALIQAVSEAVNCDRNDAAYYAAVRDNEDPPNTLSSCYSFDVCYPDCQGPGGGSWAEDPLEQNFAGGYAYCSLRCGTWTIASGVKYRIRTDKVVDGRIHGRTLSGTQLIRNSTGFTSIYRKAISDPSYILVGSVDADGYGHYHSGSLLVNKEFTDSEVYGYKVGASEVGFVWVREYVTKDASKNKWAIGVDDAGNIFRVKVSGSDLKMQCRGRFQTCGWSDEYGGLTPYSSPEDLDVFVFGGQMIVVWRDERGYNTAISDNLGQTFRSPTLTEGLTNCRTCFDGTFRYVMGVAGGNIWVERFGGLSGTPVNFHDSTNRRLVCAGTDADIDFYQSNLVVDAIDAGVYVSWNCGETWTRNDV